MPPPRPGQPAESGRHLRPPERSNLAPGEKTHYASKKSVGQTIAFCGLSMPRRSTGATDDKTRSSVPLHLPTLPDAFVFFDFAVADVDHAVGVQRDVVLVRDQNDGVA